MATRTRKKTAPKTFKAAYQILKTNAEELQSSNEPDIDNLMDTVEQSIAAYKVCQARIEAVQQALDAAFDEDADSESEEVEQESSNEQNPEETSSES
ncbi:exodeoxyribonuclease VII small subunit [Psychrobacter sp. UBA3962]|uniref:exodeoxyribonuclease VII small subunit n=1 Tax=Psychrobacter sp. UBA3962 TaxID=1947352 RepID=UPI0025D8C4D0|nr:exodeoxyribonuclease VII small subunit [Psychrobacter sp. UBA3962]